MARSNAPPRKRGLLPLVPLIIAALIVARIIYHSIYIRDVPFALATFSDGRLYEQAALDILAQPPLGTAPFYLQGAYAYFMALPMAIEPWPSLALLFQLLIASLALWWFCRVARCELGPRAGSLAAIVLLAYPMLAFYENKFLTAAPTVATQVAMLGTWFWTARATDRRRALVAASAFGVATALGILFRPNLVLVVPFFLLALASRSGPATGADEERAAVSTRTMLAVMFVLGLVVGLGPMAIRNAVVTGRATVLPTHGGGTSFYIGNNPSARGVWNTAGGLLSGDVGREQDELAERLQVTATEPSARAAQIGRALYARAWNAIEADPAWWLQLELRKLWLLVGNTEISQDYDLAGERELTGLDARTGLPFGFIVIFAGIGAWSCRRRQCVSSASSEAALVAPGVPGTAWVLTGLVIATVASNLVFFVSSQHRLPLVVPLAWLAGVGLNATWRSLCHARASRRWTPLCKRALLVAPLLVFVAWPRTKAAAGQPSAIHYYNLGVAYLAIDEPLPALEAFNRAIVQRPDHPVLRVERAKLLRRMGHHDAAQADLRVLETLENQPDWVQARAAETRASRPPS